VAAQRSRVERNVIGPVVLASALLAIACSPNANPTLRELEQEMAADNGVSLNGVSLNGVSLNGVSLNGVSLNGVSLNGVSLNGVSLNGVSLNGAELVGFTAQGSRVAGASLQGASLNGVLSNGSTIRMRIAAVTWVNDAYWYTVEYSTNAGWKPLCGVDTANNKVKAIALSGTWDTRQGVAGGGSHTSAPDQFTFACANAAIGKCVSLGYRPWWGGGWVDRHQACTRALRADYCGDGRSWTLNGRAINLYDDYWAQWDTEAWHAEAEWTANGARCIRSPRVVWSTAPSCAKTRQTPQNDCATYGSPAWPFRPRTLLITEYQSQGVGP
jgi:uncharacterized protein YjbI with pentapeptide repeats